MYATGLVMFCLYHDVMLSDIVGNLQEIMLRLLSTHHKRSLSDYTPLSPGADPGFQVRGAHLKKLRRAEGGAKCFEVFRVKNHDFTPKNHFFSILGGGGVRSEPPLPGSAPAHYKRSLATHHKRQHSDYPPQAITLRLLSTHYKRSLSDYAPLTTSDHSPLTHKRSHSDYSTQAITLRLLCTHYKRSLTTSDHTLITLHSSEWRNIEACSLVGYRR